MKVLLCQDIEKLGWLGDIVEVNNGYARNYLLPQQLAISPTEANVKSLADAKVRRAQERTFALEKLKQVVAAVDGAEAVVAAKANELGHLFGSVAERDIAANLREQGFEVSDEMVQLSEHIKEVGTHEVKLKVAADLFAMISVVVVSQDGTIDSIDEDITE
ncbi:MAG: 50S ribosomal protein L9 [Planctomycetes bacterium]|nr:50S ribosomal protein L9 [Planctomycetota bacterium]